MPSSRRRASPSPSGWREPARTARPPPRWTPSCTWPAGRPSASGSTPWTRRWRRATRRGRTAREPTHELALRIANAAFAQEGWPILQPYLDRIAATFGSGLRLVDYVGDTDGARRTINAWVSRKTEKRIPELLTPPDVTVYSRLFLVNAIYLKAGWANPFPAAATRARAFTRLNGSTVKVPTMVQQDTIPLASGAGWTATELRYEAGDANWRTPLAMTLILPDDLRSFERELAAGRLATVVRKLDTARDHLDDEVACVQYPEMACCDHPYDVRLFLPRFAAETKADLLPELASLGMTLATDPLQADFSGITSPSELYIAKVIHQANIDVDEKGTEAAAATAVGMSTTGGCGPSNPHRVITVRFDRPFFFVLRDVQTGAILFMGRVVDPSADVAAPGRHTGPPRRASRAHMAAGVRPPAGGPPPRRAAPRPGAALA